MHYWLMKYFPYSWKVPAGRRDGQLSLASDVNNLPSFRESIGDQIKKFQEKGLNTQDLDPSW